MARVLLLLPSDTYRTADFMTAAAALGAEVVVASDHRLAIAPAMGHRPLTVNFDRPEEAADRIVARAESMPLDAVIPVDDRGVEVASRAAARLGLPHNPIEAVVATRNKGALRAALTRAGMPQTAWRLVPHDLALWKAACVVSAVERPGCVDDIHDALRDMVRAGSGGAVRGHVVH